MKRQAKLITAVTLALAMATLYSHRATSAADSETITWGAADPAWSPDGKRLAFSLFGSIWQVAAEGGEAEQISASGGYHAHPAWSPDGRAMAFIRGAAPGLRIPNVSGNLVVIDLAAGGEREVRTPFPVSGTLAWSPDGRKLVCALRTPNFGAILHEIDLAGDKVSSIQAPHGLGVPWVDIAWNSRRQELFFSGQRGGAPQIWSMAPAGPPITIQVPLTRYRPEDIVQLHSLAALPDGSGLIYSAVVVNGLDAR